MKVVVTGSSGFVGKRLVKALRAEGHLVKEFDISQGNDLLSQEQCRQACKGIEAVYHLAAVLDEESQNLFEVNVRGTENILEAAAKERCTQFIFLSTVGVYGNFKGIVDEKTETKPSTKYEKSKAEAEKIVLDFQEMLPSTIVRAALVLGPNTFWEKIVKLVEKEFPLIGGGKQPWQIIYIDDLVSALVFVLGKEKCLGTTLVVAEKEKHSLKELYEEMQKALGMEPEAKAVSIWKAKLLAGFYKLKGKKSILSSAHIERLVRQRVYNTGKINKLGWQAKTGMKEAVQKTVKALKA